MNNHGIWRELRNGLLILLGVLAAGMGIKGFLLPSNFIDGGVTGISMLLSKVTSVPLYMWLPIVNLPFIAIGYRQIGTAFAIRSALGIAGLSIVLATVHYPSVTPDRVWPCAAAACWTARRSPRCSSANAAICSRWATSFWRSTSCCFWLPCRCWASRRRCTRS
jgi:uncharacterized membrane-anchored protein YitT (DUF2179 family)